MGGAKLLSREDILSVKDIDVETVDVPEWKGAVKIKGLTAAERDAFTASIATGKGRDKDVNLQNIRAKFLARCIVSEDGKPLLTEKELGDKSSAVVERLYDVAAKLSGMSEAHLNELAKNSQGSQSEDSPSA